MPAPYSSSFRPRVPYLFDDGMSYRLQDPIVVMTTYPQNLIIDDKIKRTDKDFHLGDYIAAYKRGERVADFGTPLGPTRRQRY